MKTFLLIISLSFIGATTMAQTLLPLYGDKIPNSKPGPDEEQNLDEGVPVLSNVSRPTLKIYLPEKGKANGTAVLICPGGGYNVVAFKHEGEDVAEEFIKVGIAAFVLKYRRPSDNTMLDKTIGPLQDAQQALKIIRQHTKEWNVNPNKVGILGFSAGGHLASTAGTHFKKPVIDNNENINLRPDFMILIYPVISFNDSIGHLGSRDNLLGKAPSAEAIRLYSNELQVTRDTPPAFIVHAGDDNAVKVENSLRFYEALKKNYVPAELIIFPKGGHGFGLINLSTADRWMDRCKDWMKSNEWL